MSEVRYQPKAVRTVARGNYRNPTGGCVTGADGEAVKRGSATALSTPRGRAANDVRIGRATFGTGVMADARTANGLSAVTAKSTRLENRSRRRRMARPVTYTFTATDGTVITLTAAELRALRAEKG